MLGSTRRPLLKTATIIGSVLTTDHTHTVLCVTDNNFPPEALLGIYEGLQHLACVLYFSHMSICNVSLTRGHRKKANLKLLQSIFLYQQIAWQLACEISCFKVTNSEQRSH